MRRIDRLDGEVARQPHVPAHPKGHDPELMFVECVRCGRPVMWEHGRATQELRDAGVRSADLDDHCMIVTDGCAQCRPENGAYRVKVIRISGIEQRDPLYDAEPVGTA